MLKAKSGSISITSVFAGAAVLGLAVVISSSGLQQASLWNDEAWTAWAIRSPYLRDVLARVQFDVHPPLYFMVLAVFNRIAGDSVLALRWVSLLFGLVGLAGTYAVGQRLFDRRTGLMAVVILGSAGFFVYYSREARMYSLLLALSSLATWFYLRWRQRPGYWNGAVYGVSLAALLYCHYAGGLIIVTHGLHFLLTLRWKWKRPPWMQAVFPAVVSLILFAPWLPIFIQQMRSNPNGPLAIPLSSDWNTITGLVLLLTSGSWALMLAPFVISRAIPRTRQNGNALLLLLLWLLITPIGLLVLNALFAPVYQVRYSIAMLPAGGLLVAYGLAEIVLPARWEGLLKSRLSLSAVVAGMLLLWIVYAQLDAYRGLWPAKADWSGTIRRMTAARQLLEPTISDLAAYSPAVYYDRIMGIRRGLGLDLSWRLHSATEVRERLQAFVDAPAVWVALPVNTAKSWHVVAELDQTRHIGYRDSLENMIFYRFDSGDDNDLSFRFGDVVRYAGGAGAEQQFVVAAGGSLCVEIGLRALSALDERYSVGLHLVDLSGQLSGAQWDAGLGQQTAGSEIQISPCLDIPATIPAGHYHLELAVYEWASGERVVLLEDSMGEALKWQDVLMLAAVDVTG